MILLISVDEGKYCELDLTELRGQPWSDHVFTTQDIDGNSGYPTSSIMTALGFSRRKHVGPNRNPQRANEESTIPSIACKAGEQNTPEGRLHTLFWVASANEHTEMHDIRQIFRLIDLTARIRLANYQPSPP